jgi:hypothetical protein
MVSNTLRMDLQDLLSTLKRLKKQFAKDAEYREIRRDFPKDWPL